MNAGLLPRAEGQLFCLLKAHMKDWGKVKDLPLGKNDSKLIGAGCTRYLLGED